MQVAFSGQCYATQGDALLAFQKGFPLFGDTMWTWHTSSTISSTGLITYVLTSKPTTTNTVSVRTGTLQLASCPVVDAAPFDSVAAGGVFAFFFLGVAGTWYLAQNLGLILQAVRRW